MAEVTEAYSFGFWMRFPDADPFNPPLDTTDIGKHLLLFGMGSTGFQFYHDYEFVFQFNSGLTLDLMADAINSRNDSTAHQTVFKTNI